MLDTGGAFRPSPTASEPAAQPMRGRGQRPAAAPVPFDWEVVTVPSRQGLEAVDILRLRTAVGPVLHDGAGQTLGFLVPHGTAEGWDLPGSECTRTDGRGVRLGGGRPAAGWLVPPDHGEEVTDPAQLRAALGEAARTIEAADNL